MKQLLTILLVSLGMISLALAQQGELIHVPPTEVTEGNNLTLQAMYTGDLNEISGVKVMYRLAGQVGFLEEVMEVGDLELAATLPGEIIGAPGIEYVIVANLLNGGIVAFPANDDPLSNPQFVSVSEPALEDKIVFESDNFGELVILTPEPGLVIPFGEPMITAVSLFNLDNVDIGSVRVFFDNVDVTAYSLVTTDLITYKPDALSAGKHTIFIEVSNIYGVRLSSTSWSFSVRSQAQQIFDMKINGNLNVGHRQDIINLADAERDTVIGADTLAVPIYATNTQGVSRVDFSTNINFDWAKVKIFANLTSKEADHLQPQNRYGVKIRTSWLKYSFGDETPMMNRLALWGKRVRGHNIDLRFKYANLHVVTGKTARAITGTASFDSTSSEWNRSGYSFERGIFAIRPSFGIGKDFQIGMFYVHTRDSINSVQARPSAWDGNTFSEQIFGDNGIVTVPFGADSYFLDDSTYNLEYYLRGTNPEDNIVMGSDIRLALDDRRFVMQGAAAFSLYNRNIIDGPLTRAQLDTFGLLQDTTFDDHIGTGSFGDTDSEGNKIGIPFSDIDEKLSAFSFLLTDGKFDPANLSDFFVINENLTLPVDVENLEQGNLLAALSTLALNFTLKLNYYGHFINVDYHHVGPGYKALGSPVLRLDGKGWNGWKITDKVRMLNNMLYLNLGWESYKNNTTSQDPIADPRLVQNSYTGGFTLNPGRGLPTISTNMKYFTRDNNIDEVTETIQTLSTGGDTTIVTDNRELNESLNSSVNMTYMVKTGQLDNTISLNVMRSNMDNLVIGNEGILRGSNLYGFNLRSEWGIPLTTTVSVRTNNNQLYIDTNPNFQTNTFNTYRLGAGYRLLSNHLILQGSFQYLSFKSEKFESYDDYLVDNLAKSEKKQMNLQFNAQYNFNPMTFGSTVIKSRVLGNIEQRQYISDYTDYTDRMISARYEMTF